MLLEQLKHFNSVTYMYVEPRNTYKMLVGNHKGAYLLGSVAVDNNKACIGLSVCTCSLHGDWSPRHGWFALSASWCSDVSSQRVTIVVKKNIRPENIDPFHSLNRRRLWGQKLYALYLFLTCM
jgi:hypothetical protein